MEKIKSYQQLVKNFESIIDNGLIGNIKSSINDNGKSLQDLFEDNGNLTEILQIFIDPSFKFNTRGFLVARELKAIEGMQPQIKSINRRFKMLTNSNLPCSNLVSFRPANIKRWDEQAKGYLRNTTLYQYSSIITITGSNGGTFSIIYMDHTSSPIQYNASADDVKTALESFNMITSVTVNRKELETGDGFSWIVTFKAKGHGLLNVVDTELKGDNHEIKVQNDISKWPISTDNYKTGLYELLWLIIHHLEVFKNDVGNLITPLISTKDEEKTHHVVSDLWTNEEGYRQWLQSLGYDGDGVSNSPFTYTEKVPIYQDLLAEEANLFTKNADDKYVLTDKGALFLKHIIYFYLLAKNEIPISSGDPESVQADFFKVETDNLNLNMDDRTQREGVLQQTIKDLQDVVDVRTM